MTPSGPIEQRLRDIEGMPENPREHPDEAVDALERKVDRERGDIETLAEREAVPAEDATDQDPVAAEVGPEGSKGTDQTVEPPD